MRNLVLLLILSALTGCATCREHPQVCVVGTVLAVGVIAASAHHDTDYHHFDRFRSHTD